MERLVGLALSRYLAVYIKDFSSSQFKNWTLHNLEFKEDVIQSLAGIPSNFELKKVTCNQIYAKIPSISMLGSDPIVLVADTIYIELEEPEVIRATTSTSAPAVPPPAPKQSQGLIDRVMDNIKFELRELRVKLKLRPKDKKKAPPVFELVVQDIEIKSTNSQWQVVDLRQVHTVDKNGHVIMFKEVHIGRFSFHVSEDAIMVPVLNQIPIRVRTKTKKAYFRGPTINHAIILDVLEELALKLHSKQFKVLQDAVDTLLECMGRKAEASTALNPSTGTVLDATVPTPEPAPAQLSASSSSYSPAKSAIAYTGSLWGRFATVIGSYAGYGNAEQASATPEPKDSSHPATVSKSAPPEGNSDFDSQPPSKQGDLSSRNGDGATLDEDSDEEYRDAEADVPSATLTDQPAASVSATSDEDINHTSYTIGLKSGRVSIYDFVLEEKGIAELKFANLRCQFIPSVMAVRPKICFDPVSLLSSPSDSATPGPHLTQSDLQTLETELVSQTTISIKIESYSLNQIDFGADRHPDYTYLFKRLPGGEHGADLDASFSSPDLPTLTLDFVKFPDWKNPKNLRREAQLTIDSVAIIADMRPWERLWNFFFGGQKGEKFAQYMQDNLGQMLEAALNDQVHFKLDLKRPTFLLPPYASKFPGKPHLASKVLRLHANGLTMKSVPIESLTNVEFSRGLFAAKEFPVITSTDFNDIDMHQDRMDLVQPKSSSTYSYPKRYDERDPLVMTERKFECTMSGMWIDLQADPSSKAERVLKPVDMSAQMIRREFQTRTSLDAPVQLPKWTPQLEGFVSLSEIGIAFSPSQYTFLLGMWGERLSWNPNQLTDEMKEALKMEMLLKAAESGASASTTSSIALPAIEDPPLLMRIRVFVPKVNVQLLERPEVLAGKSQKWERPQAYGATSHQDTSTPTPKVPITPTSSASTIPKSDTPSLDPTEVPYHPDSPSSTIEHNPDDQDQDIEEFSTGDAASIVPSTHVILAEMAFTELAYILESHAERSITKVSSPHFVVTSPVHADSPFSKLVSPLQTPLSGSKELPHAKPALQVRMEKFKDEAAASKVLAEQQEQLASIPLLGDVPVDPNDIYLVPTSATSPVMNVRMHGMQVCWIYTTLAEVQVFFARGDDVPVSMRDVDIPYILTDSGAPKSAKPTSTDPSSSDGPHAAQQGQDTHTVAPIPDHQIEQLPQTLGMNWAVFLTDTELVVVETPDTPECMPMGLMDARVERRGVSLDETQFEFFGKCVISSEMWQADSEAFTRSQITTPFNMEVAYIQERNTLTNGSSTNMEILIDDLQLTINRKQLIMVQNILDNQMADIRDVGAKREAQKVSESSQQHHSPGASTSSKESSTVPTVSIPVAPIPEKPLMKLALPKNSTPSLLPGEKNPLTSSGGMLKSSSSSLLPSRSLTPSKKSTIRSSTDDSEIEEFKPRSSTPLRVSGNDINSSKRSSRPGSSTLTLNTEAYRESAPHSTSSASSTTGSSKLDPSGHVASHSYISDTLVRALRNRFQVGIQKMSLKLLDPSARPIATINLNDFLYSTENWSDVSVMLIEGGSLTITSMAEHNKDNLVSPYALLLQPRLSTSIGGNADAVSVTHAPTLVPVVESYMPVISEETGPGLPSQLQAKLARNLRAPKSPKSRKTPNYAELDTIGELADGAPLNNGPHGIPIAANPTNYGSISASPMLNSFVMLSPIGSVSQPQSEQHLSQTYSGNSAKDRAPRSLQSRRRNPPRRADQLRTYEGEMGDDFEGIRPEEVSDSRVPTLSSSASVGRLSDLNLFDPRASIDNGTRGTLLSSSFATPARLPSKQSSRASPFPASGRDPHAMFNGARTQPAKSQKRNWRISENDDNTTSTGASTPTKLSKTFHSSAYPPPPPSASNKGPASPPPPRANKRSSLWTDTSDDESEAAPEETRADDQPVALAEGRMFSLKFENIQRDFKGEREDKYAKWMSRWLIAFAPFDIVYDSKAFAQLQDFFALMAEHKNLRHRYQSFQAEVVKVYREQGGIVNQAEMEHLQQSAASKSAAAAAVSQGPADDSANRVALNILISGPRVSIPQPLEEDSKAQNRTLLSVLEFSLDSIRVHNAANASPKNDHRSQTKILVSGARCFMKTVELVETSDLPAVFVQQQQQQKEALAAFGLSPSASEMASSPAALPELGPLASSSSAPTSSPTESIKTLGAISLQTQELARPMNAKIVIQMKPAAAGGKPFMHVSCDIDMIAAMISIKRYQLLMELVNNYILSFFKRTRVAEDAGFAPEYTAMFSPPSDGDKEEQASVDKMVEVNVKTVNLTVISDYMAELELVFLHLTDFNASMSLNNNGNSSDITVAGRLEVLLNNLNYMIPERLVDELNFILHLNSEKNRKKSKQQGLIEGPQKRGYAHEAMDNLRMSLPSSPRTLGSNRSPHPPMLHGEQDSSGYQQAARDEDASSSAMDVSVMVEPDEDVLSLSDFPDDDSSVVELDEADSDEDNDTTTTTLNLAVLDGLKFTLTHDLMRHLVELYQLYTQVQQGAAGKGDQSLLHFQYVLVNRTELPIKYWQTNTDDSKTLKPGDETFFTFSNPYQLKRLEVELSGWQHGEQAFSPDEVGSMVFRMDQTVADVTIYRNLIVSIQPKGLKRYVEFLSTHHVVNDTDKTLLVRFIHNDVASTTEYMVAAHTTVPISCTQSPNVQFAVSFADGAWDYSKPLSLSTESISVTDTIKLYAHNTGDERWLFSTTSREPYPAAPAVQMVTIHFAAPVVMQNLCVFPLEYYFPSMLPRRPRPRTSAGAKNMYQAIAEDEDELADSIAAVLPANSTTYFYFDTFRHREICCRLAGYSVWSGRIQIERIQQSSVELYKAADECMEGEKDDILISVFIYGRHHGFARRLAFNTQFLFVNDTDMLLFVRQQNTLPVTQIAPRQMTPFSWVRGSSKMISVNMGNTAWSPAVDISNESFQRLEIKVPNFGVSYMFLMETHTLDDYSRVVAWRSWFHIRNHSSYDLKFYLKGSNTQIKNAGDLPTFDLDEVLESEVIRSRRKGAASKRPKKKTTKSGEYSMLLNDEKANGKSHIMDDEDLPTLAEDDQFDEEAAFGDLTADFNSPMVRNTVFGNVHVSDEGWVVIPRHSNTTSGLCPEILGLSIAKDYSISPSASTENKLDSQIQASPELWSAVEIPTTSQSSYSVPISSLADSKLFRALDVQVSTDERGLYITITDNKDPPYIIRNDTPFAMRLRRQRKQLSSNTNTSPPGSGRVSRPGSSVSPHVAISSSIGGTEEYLVEPNSSFNLFAGGLGNEEEYEYRALMLTPEALNSATAASKAKHRRLPSGGLIPAPTHRRSPSSGSSTTAFSPTMQPDFLDVMSPPTTRAGKLRHSMFVSAAHSSTPPPEHSNATTTTPPPAVPLILPPITDDDEDLQSAMDGISDSDEDVDFPTDSDSMEASSSNARGPPSSKKVKTRRRNPQGGPIAPSADTGTATPPILKPLALPAPSSPKKSGHVRNPSGSGASIVSPRSTIHMDVFSPAAMDAVPTITLSAQTHPQKDSRLLRQYRQYFSSTMDAWSQPFTLKAALEFSIDWADEASRVTGAWAVPETLDFLTSDPDRSISGNGISNHMEGVQDATSKLREETPNMLLVNSQPQGKTRVVKLSLPPLLEQAAETSDTEDEATRASTKQLVVRRVMKVDVLVPEVQFLMISAEGREPAASVRLQKVQLEVSQYSNLQHSMFFVIQNAESHTLSPSAEYPVLFGVDRRALHGAHPRFLEFLVEWNVREQRTFIDYIGLRVLPFVLQIDSEILDSIQVLQELLGPLFGTGAQSDADETSPASADAPSISIQENGPSRRNKAKFGTVNGVGQHARMESLLSPAVSSPASRVTSPYASSSNLLGMVAAAASQAFTAATMDLSSPETLAEYGAVGRLGLADTGDFGGGYFYSGAANRELTENNPAMPKNRKRTEKLLAQHTNVQEDQFIVQQRIEQENFLYVGRLEIFPLRVTLSIGTNTKHWPVIAEAQMHLASFSRNDLSESIGTLFSTLGSAYSTLVWAEIYQIIGNLDAIASPLQNLRKLATGVNDFFRLPLEGLVLDDTPGAYVIGLGYGIASLMLNFTDFLLTVLMKSFQTLSWVTQVISFDEDFQKVKDRVARQHPTNAIYGMGQGVRECARGIWEGASGFVTLPMRGVQRHGAPGFFLGAGKAIIGLPLKPIGGIFDLFSKTFEGLLQTLGRGYLLQERADSLNVLGEQLSEAEIRENIQKFIQMRDQRILILDDARFMRHGRPLERYLVLTSHALYIINVHKLHFDDYSPKKIPIGLIMNLIVPVTPETQMVVKLHHGQHLWKQDQFLFIVPDRKHFILKMAARFGIKTLEVAKLEKQI